MPKPANKPTPEDLARQILKLKDRGRWCYRECDRLLAELVKAGMKPGDILKVSSTKSVKLVDNLPDGKTTAGCFAYFRRFELD